MKFEFITSFKLLSDLLRTSEDSLRAILESERRVYDAFSSHISNKNEGAVMSLSPPIADRYDLVKMYIPKKNRLKGGYRIVYKIENDRLLNIIKVIYFYLVRSYFPLDCVHGFVKEKGVTTNAMAHLGKQKILRIDIKDFFPSVQQNSVKSAFMKLGANDYIADVLTDLVTLKGELVQGFSTSPILANMIFEEIDLSIKLISDRYNCTYTRYADDLYFSTNQGLLPTVNEIQEILQKSNFQVKDDKTVVMVRGRKQYVTGLSVFDSQIPRVPKWMKNKIRFSLYYLVKFGANECSRMFGRDNDKYIILSREKLKGWIDYVNAVEPILAGKYQKEFEKIRP